ncbi:hypothetical protein CBQ26_09105 [Deinococcus indicus]|uniref:Uncharacterized protein n=1 Tax=Deinococcus indicus TaxID=223556 RepID=A0A2D0A7Z2_9DEIO|nr:hypothetical protein [Deinococcus indicus]OWL96524.1 hypothetical protein CBQ26_09105 [Deinococcus indicus]
MELIATSRRERQPVACAYGASLSDDGTRLHCELLFVMRGQTTRNILLRCPQTKTRLRVRLPKSFLRAKGHARVLNIPLEVLK